MRLILLLKKDINWHKRHITSLVVQLLVPLIVASVFSFLMQGDYNAYHEEESIISHLGPRRSRLPKNYHPPFKIKIFYPSWENTTEYSALKDFCEDLCAGYTIEQYTELEKFQDTIGYTAFLIIETWEVDKAILKYRFIDFQWKLQTILTPLWGFWSLDQKAHLSREGDIYAAWTQQLIDAHFYRRIECQKNWRYCEKSKTIGRRSFQGLNGLIVRHAAMPFFNPSPASVLIIFGQLSTFFALIVIWQVVEQMADERKTNSMMYLESLKVHNYQYLLSFFIVAYGKLFMQQLVLWIPPTIALKSSVNINIIYPGILIYATVLAAFAILMGVLFHRPLAAKFGTSCIILILNLGILAQEDRNGVAVTSWMEALIFPNAYYFFLRASATRQASGFTADGGVISIMLVPLLALSVAWMWLLALYFHVVYPGDSRRAVNWNYLYYTIKDWRKVGKSLYEEENFISEAILFNDLVSSKSLVTQMNKSAEPKKPGRVCAVQLEGVCKSLNNMWTVNRVTMKIFYDEITILYGPRGSGGKEILELISSRIQPDYGEIRRELLSGQKQSITMAEPCFLPQFTVRGLIDWSTKMRGGIEANKLNEMIDELALKEIESKRISQLNLVEKQLLSLLLAFIGNSTVILLDEPTQNCSPSIKNTIHAFIIRHSERRAIVISTYDPYEAEMCCGSTGQVAFLSRGHLVSLGSVTSTCKKYIQSMEMLVWPSGNFNKKQRMLIEAALNLHSLPEKLLPRVTWEQMPNESIRFLLPDSADYPLQKIVKDFERRRKELGIKYFEIRKQNIQSAYYNCLQKWELDEEMDQKYLAVPLENYYKEPKKKSCWPEFGCVFRMNLSFFKAHWIYHICSLLIPFILFLLLFRAVLILRKVDDEVQIGLSMLERIDDTSRIFIRETQLRLEKYIGEIREINSKTARELLEGRLIYNEPPIVAGLINKSGLFHLYHMKLLRFSDLLVQNIFINSILDAPVGEKLVHMTLESQEAIQWSSVMADQEPKDSWLQGLGKRQLASIIMRQWASILVIGGLLAMFLARSSMFIGQLAADNCIKMYYLIGARPAAFWLAVFIVDLTIFLIVLTLSLPFLIVLGLNNGISLGIATGLSILAFATFLPCIYLIALGCQNAFSTYAITSLVIGTPTLLPACFSAFNLQYGAGLEEWSQICLLLSSLFPSLAAALGTGIFDDLVQIGRQSPVQALKIITPLLVASCMHIWLWLLLATVNSSRIRSRWTKLCFWWEAKTMNPKQVQRFDDPSIMGSVGANGISATGSQMTTVANTTVSSVSTIGVLTHSAKDDTIFEEESSKRSTAGQKDLTTAKAPTFIQKIGLTEQSKISKYFATPSTTPFGRLLPAVQPVASDTLTSKTAASCSGRERLEATDTIIGLWEQRDASGSATPIIALDAVTVDHYSNERQEVSFNVFDLQSVNLFGDRPSIRSHLLDIACGQSYPKKGSVTVNGQSAGNSSRIGYVPFDDRLCTFLTGRATLELAAGLQKYRNPKAITEFILHITELTEVADYYVLDWGVSDRRMLQFAVAVVYKPKAVLLDELDIYLGPMRMKMIWGVVCLLREVFNVPVLFSSSRSLECEAISSHTVMLYQGGISLADTTVEIKKRFSSLAVLLLTIRKGINLESVASVVCSQLGCEQQPLPDSQKMAFLLLVDPDKYGELVCRVRGLMSTIGMATNYDLKLPDLDTIYHTHFTA